MPILATHRDGRYSVTFDTTGGNVHTLLTAALMFSNRHANYSQTPFPDKLNVCIAHLLISTEVVTKRTLQIRLPVYFSKKPNQLIT